MTALSKADRGAPFIELAALFEQIDKEITESWMQFPEHVRKKLNEIGLGTDLDAQAMARAMKEIAANVGQSAN